MLSNGQSISDRYKNTNFSEKEKWDFANDKVVGHTTLYAKWTKEDDGQDKTVKLTQTKKVTLKNSAKKTLKITWKKVSKATGYKVVYSTNKKFSKSKTKTVTVKNAKNSVTIKKLKKGKTYYVKVRAYKKDGTKTLYGKYSAVKKVKIKK